MVSQGDSPAPSRLYGNYRRPLIWGLENHGNVVFESCPRFVSVGAAAGSAAPRGRDPR